jgi:CheY-like chemotaxis protein
MHILIASQVNKRSPFAVNKLQPLKILLVEDNLLNIKLVSILFSRTPVQIEIAENGATAIEKIKLHDYDLVLMDMEMPVMNGYEAAAVIRQELKNNIPIIAMTAHALPGEKEKCLQAGMNEYISKPIDEDLLFSMIDILAGSNRMIIKNHEDPANPTNCTAKVCNLRYLTDITRGNKKMISNIIDVFLEETPAELSSLSEAISTTNYRIILDISHKIRSSFSLLGIGVLDPVFAEMEDLSVLSAGIEKIKLLNHRVNLVFAQAKDEMKYLQQQ